MCKLQPSVRMLVTAALIALTAISSANAQDAKSAVPSTEANSAPADSTKGLAQPSTVLPPSPKNVLLWVPNFSVGIVIGSFLFGVVLTLKRLKADDSWTLPQALSEKHAAATPTPALAPVISSDPKEKSDDPKPPAIPSISPDTSIGSSSRLIAFLGMIAMLSMFMGIGLYLLWALFNGKGDDAKKAMDAASTYLLYGSALYAPYAFNQLKAAFSA